MLHHREDGTDSGIVREASLRIAHSRCCHTNQAAAGHTRQEPALRARQRARGLAARIAAPAPEVGARRPASTSACCLHVDSGACQARRRGVAAARARGPARGRAGAIRRSCAWLVALGRPPDRSGHDFWTASRVRAVPRRAHLAPQLERACWLHPARGQRAWLVCIALEGQGHVRYLLTGNRAAQCRNGTEIQGQFHT